MRIVFSESNSDYSNYQFPYCIWALEEPGDSKSNILNNGFLPSGSNPTRYYLCRSLRVSCDAFYLSSENKRVLSKNKKLEIKLIRKNDITLTDEIISMCMESAEARFDNNVMTYERLTALLSSIHTTHYLVLMDDEKIIGLVTCLSDGYTFVHYNFSFFSNYDGYSNLGIYMMTKAIQLISSLGMDFIYLGTAYNERSKYKLQFHGMEFFNGIEWRNDLKELKFLLKRDGGDVQEHLLECQDYVDFFLGGNLSSLVK